MLMGFAMALFEGRPDVVVATSPQFFCALAGWAVSVARRRPFVLELRDLWPASIVAVGAMRRSGVIRALERVEMLLYRRATAIVAVTESFRQREDIAFLFVGGGADRARVEAMVAERKLENVVMLARQPKERMPEIWSLCDVALIPLRDAPLFRTVIPSKIFECMGMGIPILM